MSIIANQSGDLISSLLVPDFFFPPDTLDNFPLLDYEEGGVGLNDPSEGLQYQHWTLRYFPGTGDVVISAPNTANTILFTRADISQISLAFDQNMNPFVAFVEAGVAKYWWWDPNANMQIFSNLPANSLTPRCCIDDKRDNRDATSDIILCYVTDGVLYSRQERDRYTIEYTLQDPFLHPVFEFPAVLIRVGMNKKMRLQWLCDLANPIDWCGYVNYGN